MENLQSSILENTFSIEFPQNSQVFAWKFEGEIGVQNWDDLGKIWRTSKIKQQDSLYSYKKWVVKRLIW